MDGVSNAANTASADLTHASEPTRQRSLWNTLWKSRVSYLMLLPFFIPFIIFGVLPMGASIYLSLTDYSGASLTDMSFVGGENFRELLSLEFRTVAREVDADTGEYLFRCGRSQVTASNVAAAEADGATCAASYVRSREVLSEGFEEYAVILQRDDRATVVGATDPRFWKAMTNTSNYVAVTVVARVVLGLVLALALQHQSALNMGLRTIFFLPSVTSTIAITVVWGYLFTGKSYGLLNSLRNTFGFETIEFLADAAWTMPILMLLTVWGGIGYNMILFLAGLQSISQDMYEAATVDGASTWDKFWYITLPLLRPTTVFIVITSIIGSFQVFDAVYVLFASPNGNIGGALDSVLTVVTYLYERGFRLFDMGYASAIAWVLFVIIFIFTMINLQVGQADEAY